MDNNQQYRVRVTFLASGAPFYSVIEDIPDAPRYDGTLEECRALVFEIARGMRPCRLEQDGPLHWVLYALNGGPTHHYEIVPVPDGKSVAGQISGLLQQMQQASRNADTEGAHGQADWLLVKALQVLATDDTRADIEAMIQIWDDMDKWYA